MLRWVWQKLLAVLLATAVTVPTAAADLIVAIEAQITGLRPAGRAWEAATGHRLVWLPYLLDADTDVGVDVYVLRASSAQALVAQGRLRILRLLDVDASAPPMLLANMWRKEDGWLALPLLLSLPMLRVVPSSLNTRKFLLSGVPSWLELARLAGGFTNPVNSVYGLCIDPRYAHAALIRAMLTAAGETWLDSGGGLPYTGTAWPIWTQHYARMLAAAGPPNSASLRAKEFVALRNDNGCAMWLSTWRPNEAVADLLLLPVPGAVALLERERPVIAVDVASEQANTATEMAWALAVKLGQWDVDALGLTTSQHAAVVASLAQNADKQVQQVQVASDWLAADAVGQGPLRKVVEGVLPVTEALAVARAAAVALSTASGNN